jgi:hypothetical protein
MRLQIRINDTFGATAYQRIVAVASVTAPMLFGIAVL